MAKYLHLQIPQSCHEDWNKMLPDQKGKYCLSCQKQVTDFTKMSDRELVDYFKNYTGTGCGKFSQDQLDRDIFFQKKSIPLLKYFFQLVLPAFLLSLKSIGQTTQKGRVRVVVTEQIVNNVTGDKILKADTFEKEGVKNRPPQKLAKGLKSASSEPLKEVQLPLVKADNQEHNISSSIIDHAPSEQILNTEGLVGRVGGFVASVKTITRRDRVKAKDECKQVAPSLSIYPNPVNGSSTINVKWQGLEKGEYRLELYNSQGALMQVQELAIESWMKEYALKLQLQVSGIYVVKITNKKNGKHLSQQFVVN